MIMQVQCPDAFRCLSGCNSNQGSAGRSEWLRVRPDPADEKNSVSPGATRVSTTMQSYLETQRWSFVEGGLVIWRFGDLVIWRFR